MSQQITIKLAVAEGRHSAVIRHAALLKAIDRTQQHLVSIYYDTRRLDLLHHGVRLRLRKNGPAWEQTVSCQESPHAELSRRPEWHTSYLNHFHFEDIDDAGLRQWLQRSKIFGHLSAIFETNFRRTLWRLEPEQGTRILVKLDRGWIASAGRREAISELKLQLECGPAEALYALATQLSQRQALPLLLLSKAERGYRLFLNTSSHPVKSGNVAINPNDTPLAAFRQIALDCLAHLQLNHAGAIHSDDAEYVHQMRVATRRLRAAMRMFRPVLPADFAEHQVPPLRALMATLGQARDLDVLMSEIVDPVARALPEEPRLTDLASAITNRRYAARAHIRTVLQKPDYGQLLLNASSRLHSAPFIAPPANGQQTASLLEFADRRLQRLLKRVLELADAARIDHPPSLHELRIAIKRLRYAIEFFGPMIPGKSGVRIIRRLAGLQEELGQLNDLASAGTLLMACAGSDSHLREAVTLIGGWHGPRHAALLGDIPNKLKRIRKLKLPRLGKAAPETR